MPVSDVIPQTSCVSSARVNSLPDRLSLRSAMIRSGITSTTVNTPIRTMGAISTRPMVLAHGKSRVIPAATRAIPTPAEPTLSPTQTSGERSRLTRSPLSQRRCSGQWQTQLEALKGRRRKDDGDSRVRLILHPFAFILSKLEFPDLDVPEVYRVAVALDADEALAGSFAEGDFAFAQGVVVIIQVGVDDLLAV